MQKHLWCKKVWASKVKSYLELNTCTDWQQQDLITEYGQETQNTEHIIITVCILQLTTVFKV